MPKQTDYLRKGAEAPAEFLDRTIATTQNISNAVPAGKLLKKTKD